MATDVGAAAVPSGKMAGRCSCVHCAWIKVKVSRGSTWLRIRLNDGDVRRGSAPNLSSEKVKGCVFCGLKRLENVFYRDERRQVGSNSMWSLDPRVVFIGS